MPAEFNPHRSLRLAKEATPEPWINIEYEGSQGHKCIGVAGPQLMCASVNREQGAPDAAHIADARTALPEACRRLIRLRELLAKTLALAVEMEANYILEPPKTAEILAALTWEGQNDG